MRLIGRHDKMEHITRAIKVNRKVNLQSRSVMNGCGAPKNIGGHRIFLRWTNGADQRGRKQPQLPTSGTSSAFIASSRLPNERQPAMQGKEVSSHQHRMARVFGSQTTTRPVLICTCHIVYERGGPAFKPNDFYTIVMGVLNIFR